MFMSLSRSVRSARGFKGVSQMKIAYERPTLVKREALSQITATANQCISGLACKQ